MKLPAHLPQLALATSILLFAFAGCSGLCDLRDPQTRQPIPSQFQGTAGTVQRAHSLTPPAVMVDIDHDSCAGFERFVFEFEGGVPGYKVGYVDKPIRESNSGRVVPVAGDAWLKIAFSSAQGHEPVSGEVTITDRNQTLDLGNALQLVQVGELEGRIDWVLGLRFPGRFRVTELTDPPRIVLDVKTR